MIGKAFWLSKTFWVNVLAGVAIVAQALWGWVMDPEVETSILAGINLVLRLVTKEPITWSTPTIPPAAMILVAVLGMAVLPGCGTLSTTVAAYNVEATAKGLAQVRVMNHTVEGTVCATLQLGDRDLKALVWPPVPHYYVRLEVDQFPPMEIGDATLADTCERVKGRCVCTVDAGGRPSECVCPQGRIILEPPAVGGQG